MSARTAVRGRRRAHAGRISYSRECLSRLARILVRCGHSPNDLVSELRAICRTFKEPSRDWDPTQLGFLADLPHVIALWHSDPSYLDPRGKPAALPLRGRGPTLKSLIGRVLPDEDLKSVTQALVRMRGLRVRAGRYLPTGRHLSYRQESGRLYSLNALLRMLRTVERNVAGRKNAAIFERSAINPNFPSRHCLPFTDVWRRGLWSFFGTSTGTCVVVKVVPPSGAEPVWGSRSLRLKSQPANGQLLRSAR